MEQATKDHCSQVMDMLHSMQTSKSNITPFFTFFYKLKSFKSPSVDVVSYHNAKNERITTTKNQTTKSEAEN